jgi:flagellar basal body-associated protein FliL
VWEIIIISIIGLAALAYLIIFFIMQSKKKNACIGCPYGDECKKRNLDKRQIPLLKSRGKKL